MEFDFVIIGSGPAGSVLSDELSNSGYKVALIERAKNLRSKTINDFFCPYIDSCPNYYTPVFSNNLGGNSELWHSKVYLLSEDEIDKFNWNIKYEDILNFSSLLAKKFNIEERLISKFEENSNKSKYVYSLRANFRNIFKFLNIDKNEKISVFKGYSPVEIIFDKLRAKEIIITNYEKNRERIVIKKAIIFCAGGLGNPHLLLNLVKNENSLLGKYLSDHPHVNLGKIKNSEFTKFKKIAKPNILNNLNIKKDEVALVLNDMNIFAGMQLDYKTDPIRKLRRVFIRFKSINLRKFLSIFSFIIQKFNGLYSKLGLFFGRYYKYSFEYFFSQTPNLKNKVYLSDKIDEFGLNKINVVWNVNDEDLNKYNKLIQKNIGENGFFLKTSQNIKFENYFYKNGLSGLHPSCTTKIGTSSNDGVVDSNLKLFTHDNIYVCGSSVFPFNGYTNPTWTIMTLSLRLAEKLKKIL